MELTSVSRELRYRYRLFQRPQGLVERNTAICSGQPVFRGTRIPVAVVVEQLRTGVSREELEQVFPQLSSHLGAHARHFVSSAAENHRPSQPVTFGCRNIATVRAFHAEATIGQRFRVVAAGRSQQFARPG